jgi:hypothetical protein
LLSFSSGFASAGQLVISLGAFEYSYSPLESNINKRTLQGFSTQAEEKMDKCENCPYVTYEKFEQYYGAFDYSDAWVTAAFEGRATSFANGNVDFSGFGYPGRTGMCLQSSILLYECGRRFSQLCTRYIAEAIKKGSAYMGVWMYVIREMEDALDDCQEGCKVENCNDDPVHAWDEGVAFYSGSLEGGEGEGSGVLLHQLADKRCANFKTCGDLASETSGISHANLEIFHEFRDGQRKLSLGQCSAARTNKERIEQLMAIPLVQGTLRYAYITDFEVDAGEKAAAEGAVFAASVLPLVNACNEEAASKLYKSMNTGQNGGADFLGVKHSLEQVYSCMGLRCEDVGGLYDDTTGGYLKHASPCGLTSDKNIGLIVGLSFGGVALLAFLVFLWRKSSTGQEVVKREYP